MSGVARRLALALALAATTFTLAIAPPTWASEEPLVRWVADDRAVVLDGLPNVLHDAEIVERLTSGLTTTLLIEVAARDRRGLRGAGALAVRLRYDLWDEQFSVQEVQLPNGGTTTLELSSLEALDSWWAQRRLTVTNEQFERPIRVDLELTVIPFTTEEQDDAQRWFARALKQGDTSGSSNSSVLELLLASSIRRESAERFTWRVRLE